MATRQLPIAAPSGVGLLPDTTRTHFTTAPCFAEILARDRLPGILTEQFSLHPLKALLTHSLAQHVQYPGSFFIDDGVPDVFPLRLQQAKSEVHWAAGLDRFSVHI
jgi:hypothetical protein